MMNSEKHDEHIISQVEEFIGVEQRMVKPPWHQHDNVPCHRSPLKPNRTCLGFDEEACSRQLPEKIVGKPYDQSS